MEHAHEDKKLGHFAAWPTVLPLKSYIPDNRILDLQINYDENATIC